MLQWPHVEDAGTEPGWLIFSTGPSELGVHPTSGGSGEGAFVAARQHQVTLMCDDIEQTVAELTGRGARFTSEVTDMGFGLTAMMALPGADDLMLYQPRHQTAYGL